MLATLWGPLPPTASAQEPQPAEDPEAAEPAEEERPKASFKVALDAAQGGGSVVGEAADFDYDPGKLLLAFDEVEIKYRDLTVTADQIRLDIPANKLTAEGNVVLDEGPERMSGDVLEYDITSRTGRMTNAKAYVEPDIYFSGREIAKTGAVTYTIEDGVFTSCEGDSPSWSFALSEASVTLEEYARIKNARLRFKKLPVLYFPYILWPATTERTSGWLVPRPSYSDREGVNIGLAYYRTLGRSADATFFFDLSAEEYNGIGAQYRYRPSENTTGQVDAYFLMEPDDAFIENAIFDPDRVRGDNRWKLAWSHESTGIWNRFRGVVNLQLYSDFDYLRDIERSVNRQTRSFIYSNAYLSANEGPHSFNILVDKRELISSNQRRNTRRQLPEIEYRLRPTQLGGLPIYFSLQSSANAFQVEIEDPPPEDPDATRERTTLEYARADFAPSLSISLSSLSWLSVKTTLGGRATNYTDSAADPNEPTPLGGFDDPLPGGSLTRLFPSAQVEVIGPSFSKVFDSKSDSYSKFKHIIEPRVTYTWVDEFDDIERIPVFDSLDNFRPFNGAEVAVINRLMAKPRDEEEGGAFEIASLEVAQTFFYDDFDDNPETDPLDGPVVVDLRINPSEDSSFRGEWRYDTENSQLVAQSLSGGTELFGRHGVGLTWFTRWRALDGEETSNQVRLFTRFELLREKLFFDAQVNYNLLDNFDPTGEGLSRLQDQRYLLDFRSQCYSWILEFRETQYRSFEDSEVRFSLSLKNVGTFLDINESF
ncbi:MAG: LPS assembly protein LptD [Acidobacteriota bacterium]